MTRVEAAYLVVNHPLTAAGRVRDPAFRSMTERHHFRMPTVDFKGVFALRQEVLAPNLDGVILALEHGLPDRDQFNLAAHCLAEGRPVFFYWPREAAIEAIDAERLGSMRRHRAALYLARKLKTWLARRRAADAAAPAAATAGADSGVVAENARHIGREAESLETHLRGGVAEIRRATGANADMLAAQAAQAVAQLRSIDVSALGDSAAAVASPVASALSALEAIGALTGGVREFGSGVAAYIEGGLPVLDRVKQQSAAVSQDVTRLAPAPAAPAIQASAGGPFGAAELPSVAAFLRSIAEEPKPVPPPFREPPTQQARLSGTGMYLRLDFWAPLSSGGSYGHTCYQARALANTTQDFVAVMANRFELIDTLGLRQVVVPAHDPTGVETNILGMNRHYAERLGPIFDAMRPAYIFERAVLGSAVGAWASRRFGIPYIVEYNGSEISMKRSFANSGYEHEDLLLLAEDAAFRQATLVSVISDHVAADVARRGVPEERILVNPNAVDLAAYRPGLPEERGKIRAGLGLRPEERVVGFIGTFGGWHGIDVLAAALPRILDADPSVRFLLIGDGNLKSSVTEVVAARGLSERVVDVGRVPQTRGAELLKACDILVSPHSSNMVDSPFFGSPTKLFEYMAMGAGIVASDLEQIAHVLSPALRASDFDGGEPPVGEARAVLCRPGDVDDFVAGVLALARHKAAAEALGRNARRAAESHYSWDQHVRNLWLRLAGRPPEGYAADRRRHAR